MENWVRTRVQRLIADWGRGRDEAWDQLLPFVKEHVLAWAAASLHSQEDLSGRGDAVKIRKEAARLFDEMRDQGAFRFDSPLTQFFEICDEILLRILEEIVRRDLFRKREEEPKINLYTASVNHVENRAIEILDLRRFLAALEKKMGRLRRTIFFEKYILGYTLQEIADRQDVGKGSVRHHLKVATAYFVNHYEGVLP